VHASSLQQAQKLMSPQFGQCSQQQLQTDEKIVVDVFMR